MAYQTRPQADRQTDGQTESHSTAPAEVKANRAATLANTEHRG